MIGGKIQPWWFSAVKAETPLFLWISGAIVMSSS